MNGEGIVQIGGPFRKQDLIADVHLGRPHRVGGQQTLVVRIGPGAFDKDRPVDIVRVLGFDIQPVVAFARPRLIDVKGMDARRVLHAVDLRDDVRLICRHDTAYAFNLGNLVDLIVGEPERGNNAQIAQVGRVVVRVARKTHVGAGETQARIEAASERRNDGNSEEAPKRMGDRSHYLFAECPCHWLPLNRFSGGGVSVLFHSGNLALANMDHAVGDVGKRGIVCDEHDGLARVRARVLQKL